MSDMERHGRAMLARALGDERQEFGSFFLSRLLGFTVTYEGESCLVSFEVVPPLHNPQGSLHGGVLAAALDISMGHLLHRTAGAGATLEIKVQYLAPAVSGRVTCRGGFLRRGRSISFLESRATREDGETIALATATWRLLKGDRG